MSVRVGTVNALSEGCLGSYESAALAGVDARCILVEIGGVLWSLAVGMVVGARRVSVDSALRIEFIWY